MRKHGGWIPVLALAAAVAVLGSTARAQNENAMRDSNRVPALLLTNPATGLTDRWESDGNGSAAVSITGGGMAISGPVTAVTSGGDKISTETTAAAILTKLLAAPATEAKQDTGNTSLVTIAGKDFATETTLVAFNSKAVTLDTGAVVILTFPDNEPFDLAQVGGIATATGSGTIDAGTQRMVIATDQPAIPVTSGRPTETVEFASVTITATGPTTIVTATASKKIRVLAITSSYKVSGGSANADGVIHFGARSNTSEFFTFTYPDFGGDAEHWDNDSAPQDTTVNQPLVIATDTLSGTGQRLRFTVQFRKVD